MSTDLIGSPSSVVQQTAIIRPLRKEDREPLRNLLSGTAVFTDEEIGIALELIDTVLTRPDQKDYVIFVHQTGDTVDGYYCIGPTPGTAGTFDLYWIAVSPSSQGRGVGSALNRHAEEYAGMRGGRLVIVETSSGKKYDVTREFYRRQGYDQAACIADYYRPGDDLVIYRKNLTRKIEGG